jgi:ADP-ribose pyrophosphatase
MSGEQFTVLGDEERLRGFAFTVVDRAIAAPDGTRFHRDLALHLGAVAIIPVDGDRNVHLIRQYRASIDRYLLEIPAGLRDHGGEPELHTAHRELLEECGLRAGAMVELGVMLNSAGWTDQKTWLFLATDLEDVGAAPEGIEEHFIDHVVMPLDELCAYRDPLGIDIDTVLAAHLARTYLG